MHLQIHATTGDLRLQLLLHSGIIAYNTKQAPNGQRHVNESFRLVAFLLPRVFRVVLEVSGLQER
jgi:hypothetical protein